MNKSFLLGMKRNPLLRLILGMWYKLDDIEKPKIIREKAFIYFLRAYLKV